MKKQVKKAIALLMAAVMALSLNVVMPGKARAAEYKTKTAAPAGGQESQEPVYVEARTDIIYGTKGGTPNVTFEGGYATQGDPLTGNDLIAAGGAVKWTGAKYHSAGYGISVDKKATLEINVKGDTKITFVTSSFNTNGKTITGASTDAGGTFTVPEECKVTNDGDKLVVLYTAGEAETATITLSFSETVYVPALTIEPTVCVEAKTDIIYGTVGGGTKNVTFEGGYATQGDPLTGNDLIAAGGAVKWTGAKYHSAGYGISVDKKATLEINVKGDTKITFVTSSYNAEGKMITGTSTDAGGTFTVPEDCKVTADGNKLEVMYTAGEAETAAITLSFSGAVYVPAVTIEPVNVFAQYKPPTDGKCTVRVVYKVPFSEVEGKTAIGIKYDGNDAVNGDGEAVVGTNVYSSLQAGAKRKPAGKDNCFVIVEITDVPNNASFTVQPVAIGANGESTDLTQDAYRLNMTELLSQQ